MEMLVTSLFLAANKCLDPLPFIDTKPGLAKENSTQKYNREQ